jgi:hypothetical protein
MSVRFCSLVPACLSGYCDASLRSAVVQPEFVCYCRPLQVVPRSMQRRTSYKDNGSLTGQQISLTPVEGMPTRTHAAHMTFKRVGWEAIDSQASRCLLAAVTPFEHRSAADLLYVH